ncbi:CTP synthase [Candidatus Microgenomates bacterium]|nr:CTP synthase [Candidatus Microgenomates bacterium]
MPAFIFVSGGVISGLGKGITTASIGLLLKSYGLKVAPIKCDPYVNVDAGTMNPIEHGEVFVTDDGIETDQDIGHYERFLNESLSRVNYTTTGQIYQSVIKKERALGYNGRCVEVVPHVPEEMIRRFKEAGRKTKADVVIIEIGGTVGEYQNVLFIEANRIMKVRDKENVIHIHLGYLPVPPSLKEMKTKPIQISTRMLNETGIQPDFIVARGIRMLDKERKEKIALFCNVDVESVISNPDVESIYETPLILDQQGLGEKIIKKLGQKRKKKDLQEWRELIKKIQSVKKRVVIGIVGKYQKTGDYILSDAYVSVVEAIKHASWYLERKPEIVWLDAERLQPEMLKKIDGLIVPQGWGGRGVEGKIKAVQFVREKGIPYLGLCFGMQMAVIEFSRNVCGLKNAHSVEVNPKTPHPVINIMPNQEAYLKKHQYGGTIRLGAWPCRIRKGTVVFRAYNKTKISERHRHRYELNNQYRERLEKAGLVIAGTSPDGKLVEVIELSKKLHPFFVGTQFHPEYKSRPLFPHPIFLAFIKACVSD